MVKSLRLLICWVIGFCICMGTPFAYGETYVSGNITVGTIWSKSNSPYIVTGTVQVLENIPLTIEPGVAVKFNPSTGLNIGGKLIAIGTQEDPITFTSNAQNPSKGDWDRIKFVDTAQDASYDADGNYLDGCIIKNSIIEFGKGVWCEYSSPFIYSNYIKSTTNNGGIYSQYSSNMKIINNTLEDNGIPIVLAVSSNAEIVGNILRNNGDGILLSNASNVLVKNNTIEYNGGNNVGAISITYPPGSGFISSNYISHNKKSYQSGIVYCENTSPTIEDNIITNNGDNAVGCLQCNATISNNLIARNEGYAVFITTRGRSNNPIITHNDLVNLSKFEIYLDNYVTGNIVATNNWWGTTDISTIESKIYDYYDNISLGRVIYSPIAMSPFFSTIEDISAPNPPSGPNIGVTGVSYSFSTGGSSSSIGDTIEYQFDWKGDGLDLSNWGSVTQAKTWTVAGTYNVRARARCTTHTSIVSGWSGSISVTISSGVSNTATRDLPDYYTPSIPFLVTIIVTPREKTNFYAVEDVPPKGWTVSEINENGQWDDVNKKVKWGPFFDANNRTLTYKATPPVGETGPKTFSGTVSFDGTNVTIGGSSSILRKGAAIPDFNGDGQIDILWRNKTTGQNVVWFMNGTTYSNYAELMQVTDTNWQSMGTGDFNGDGKTDVLWRNKSTGQNVVWLMDGVNYGSYAWLLEVADLNWEIVGTGDFNGDGKTDILWRNKATGENMVWYMDGVTRTGWSYIEPAVSDLNWEIVGTGDFNGDGKRDILWRNKATGQNVVWFMDGVAYGSYAWLLEVTDLNWEIVGTGDFNGDGKTDILWRNKSTGQNIVWLMNGTTYNSYTWLPDVPDINWEIVGPK